MRDAWKEFTWGSSVRKLLYKYTMDMTFCNVEIIDEKHEEEKNVIARPFWLNTLAKVLAMLQW